MIDLRPITLYVTTDQWSKLATYASERNFSINDAVIEMFERYGDLVADLAHKCENCASTVDVTLAPDPYGLEINDDDSCHWLCANFRQESADDI